MTDRGGTLPQAKERRSQNAEPQETSKASEAGLPAAIPGEVAAILPGSHLGDLHGREVPETIEREGESRQDESAAEAVRVSTTRQDRLDVATLAGGLRELPPNFGDADGDWATVQSENPFEVLYLSYRLADRISPEVVSRHRKLLNDFWREKLKNLTQGAARLAILKKYGGTHESDRLVSSFPERIETAFEQISSTSGIEAAYREIVTGIESAFLSKVDQKLDDFLIDSNLRPEETLAIMSLADREQVSRAVVAEYLQKRLEASGFVAQGAECGKTLEQRLLSCCWVRAVDAIPPAPAAKKPARPVRFVPALLFSLVVVVVLIVAAALQSGRTNIVSEPISLPNPPGAVPPASTEAVRVQDPERDPEPEPPKREPVSQAVTPVEPPLPPPATQPTISEEENLAVQTELAQLRSLGETDPQAALERSRQLEAKFAEHPESLTTEQVELAKLEGRFESAILQRRIEVELKDAAEAETKKRRLEELERQLAQAEALAKQGNYSGAKILVDAILAQKDLSGEIAQKARKLSEELVAQLRSQFSKTKAKSKTSRTLKPPPHD
jgi:hypothetical protein